MLRGTCRWQPTTLRSANRVTMEIPGPSLIAVKKPIILTDHLPLMRDLSTYETFQPRLTCVKFDYRGRCDRLRQELPQIIWLMQANDPIRIVRNEK